MSAAAAAERGGPALAELSAAMRRHGPFAAAAADDVAWRAEEVRGELARPERLERLAAPLLRVFAAAGIDPRGARVLDLGCGAGGYALLFAHWGARSVTGVDLHPGRIAAFHALAAALSPQRRELLDIRRGRVEEAVRGERFDLVFCNEALSHLLAEDAAGLLAGLTAPGGWLAVFDGNNGANPAIRRSTRRFWRRVEEGPPGTWEGRDIPETYTALRRRLLLGHFGGALAPEQADLLAARTAGLHGPGLLRAGERFLAARELPPPSAAHAPPVHPEAGVYWENLLDPFALRDECVRAGFVSARLHASLPGSYRWGWAARVDAHLPLALKIRVATCFALTARRPAGDRP